MTFVHCQDYQVRHYECDAYGHVNHANYLRYMQEAAFGASAAVGFGPDRYAARKLAWLAYETDIEYLQPLHYGDSFSVRTWIGNFRKVRSLRHYEFYRDGELITRGSTDWVLIDLTKRTPTAIDDEIIAAYSAGVPFEPTPTRTPLPPPPRPPADVFTVKRHVEWEDIDPAGHVNNAVYLNYVADAAFQAHRTLGWPLSRLESEGLGLMARRHYIEYRTQAALDDEIEIATWITDVQRSRAMRYTVMRRVSDGKLVARVRTLWLMCNLHTKRPARLPRDLLADFAPHIA